MKNVESIGWVDRDIEIENIGEIYFCKNYKAIVVYGISGIGKSILTQKYALSAKDHFDYIFQVRTTPKNQLDNLIEGKFLKDIYSTILKKTNDLKKINFKNYIRYSAKDLHKNALVDEVDNAKTSNSLKTFLGKVTFIGLLKRILHLGKYDATYYLNSNDIKSLLVISSYIKFVLKKAKCLVIIDNLQNIDNYSLKMICELLASNEINSKFLFEFTLKDCTVEKLGELIKTINLYNVKIKAIKINALSPKYAIKAISNYKQDDDEYFDNLATEFYINHSNGSIQKLIDYTFQFYNFEKNILSDNDPTLGKLNSLNSNELFILAIILLHDGMISLKRFNSILSSKYNIYAFDHEAILKNLSEKYQILKISNSIIELKHASTSDSWESSIKFKKYQISACKLCQEYYEADYFNSSCTVSKDNSIFILLKIYSLINPEKIFELFETMQEELNKSILPEKIWKYIMVYLNEWSKVNIYNETILIKLIVFTFNFNLYTPCLYLIDKLRLLNNEKYKLFCNIYTVNCLEYLGQHQKAICICEKSLSEHPKDKEAYNYNLLLLGCYRSINKGIEWYLMCENNIKNINGYKNFYPEYGIFLRLSEIYKSHKDAVKDLKESVDYFVELGDILQEVKSRILYAFLLTSQGLHDQAKKEYNACDQILNKRGEFRNIIAMNKASMLLRQGNFGYTVEDLLQIAELSTTGTYDTLLLLNLRLCNDTCMKKYGSLDSIVYRMKKMLSTETDKLLLASTSYNLFIYYKIFSAMREAQYFYNLAIKYRKHNSFVDKALKTANLSFIPKSSSDWSLGITFFWNVDYNVSTLLLPLSEI